MDFIEHIKKWFELKVKLWTKKDKIVFKGEKFTRPVLIFKKFTRKSFLGLPLTTHGKKGSWYVEIDIRGEKQYVLLNQARILDKKRLTNKLDDLSIVKYQNVKKRFIEFYNS